MYTDEIKRLLKEKNFLLTGDEFCEAFDPKVSTQVSHIICRNPDLGEYEATTKEEDGEECTFNFKVYYKKKY